MSDAERYNNDLIAELSDEITTLQKEKAQLEAELGDFRDRRDERFQMYEDCKVENEALKREIERLRELPERIKRMCYVKEAWQADGALCDIEDYIDSLLEGSE